MHKDTIPSLTMVVPTTSEPDATDWHSLYLREKQAHEEAEARYQHLNTVLSGLGDCLIMLDSDLRYRYASESALRLMNRTAEQVLGKAMFDLYPQLRGTEYEQVVQTALAEQKPVEYTMYYPNNGKWWQILINPAASGLTMYFRDVSEKKMAETERHNYEEERRYMMAGANCLLWRATVEEQGHPDYLHWEMRLSDADAAQRFLPLSMREDETYHNAWYHSRLPEDQDASDRLGTASVRAGQSYAQEYRCVCADGSIHWVHEDVRVETVTPGQRWEVVAVCTDVTERRRMEEEREKHVAHIEALLARIKRAMQETHHRVKNNLQVLVAFLDMAIQEHADALPIAEVRRLSQQVMALAQIHDILTNKVISIEESETLLSAREVMGKLLSMLSATTPCRLQHEIQDVELSIKQATALTLAANELVSNGFKHGGKTVRVSLCKEGLMIRLSVEDDGPGWPESFDLNRASSTGLSLVEQLSRYDLGGEFLWENRNEGGARVTITFPPSAAVVSSSVVNSKSHRVK